MSTEGGDDRPQRPHQADRQACGHDHPQMDRANASRRSVCHVVLGVDGKTRATQAVPLQVLTCVISHIGRQRSDQQLGGSRSLVGSTCGERLVDSHLVVAHSGDVLRASAVLHHDRGRRPALAGLHRPSDGRHWAGHRQRSLVSTSQFESTPRRRCGSGSIALPARAT
jgi:hypothetical protein